MGRRRGRRANGVPVQVSILFTAPPFKQHQSHWPRAETARSVLEEGPVTVTTRVARTVLPTMSTARALASPPARSLAPRASTRRRETRARLVRGRSLKLPRGPKLPRLGPAAGAAAAAAASDDDPASSIAETSDEEADADRRRRFLTWLRDEGFQRWPTSAADPAAQALAQHVAALMWAEGRS